jgi:hypothetical protein
MSELESQEIRSLKRELTTLHSKPINIAVDACKTIEAYDLAFSAKQVQATSKRDYPRSDNGYRAVQRLLQFDAIIKPDKGITTKIDSLVIQPVTENNEKKYALYYHARYVGYDAWDNEIGSVFSNGYHWRPKLQFTAFDVGSPFDPQTGERRGSYKPQGKIIIHDIFVPENPKERKKWLEDFVKDKDVTNTVFSFRQPSFDNLHSGMHSQVSFENLCNLTFDQLIELTTKNYYKDNSGNLTDKDGYKVRFNNDKIESMK